MTTPLPNNLGNIFNSNCEHKHLLGWMLWTDFSSLVARVQQPLDRGLEIKLIWKQVMFTYSLFLNGYFENNLLFLINKHSGRFGKTYSYIESNLSWHNDKRLHSVNVCIVVILRTNEFWHGINYYYVIF